MYAVLEIKNKQYKVSEGELVKIDFQPDAKENSEITVENILVYQDGTNVKFGFPYVKGVKAVLEVVKHDRDDKVIVFKYKSGKGYKRTKGHKQDYTVVKVKKIG